MAFVPAKRQIATYPISIHIYNEAGKKEEIRFTAQYKRLGKSELEDLQDGLMNAHRIAFGEEPLKRPDGSTPAPVEMNNVEFLQKYMQGWIGIKNEDGTTRECNPATVEELLEDYPELAAPMFNGFFAAHRQISEKN